MKWLPQIVAMVVLLGTAQGAEELTPEGIVRRQIEGMHNLDWSQVATYTHPKALAQLKNIFLPVAEAGAAGGANNAMAAKMMQTLFGGKTPETLAAESPSDFFQTVMNGMANVVPDFRGSMQGMQAEMIGHVDEGAMISHVVYRLTRTAADGTSTTKMAVTSVERDGVVWKALLNTDLESLARAITARLNAR